ncbi:hypothetical protein [Pontibacter rugosus]
MYEKNAEFGNSIKALDKLNKLEISEPRLGKVHEYNARLKQLMEEVEHTYELLYSLDKNLCNCGDAS